MQKIIALLLCLICIFGYAYCESCATPTDLVEFDDDDYGCITATLGRQIFVDFLKQPTYYGEEVTIVAILINFRPDDEYTFQWEYSPDEGETWFEISGEIYQTYTFIITEENCNFHWRVRVIFENDIDG